MEPGIAGLGRGDGMTENQVGRGAAAVNEKDFARPRLLSEITGDAHHRRDADASANQDDALRLDASERELADRAPRFDFVPDFQEINPVA